MLILSKLARGASAAAIAVVLTRTPYPALASDNPKVAAEVMALARAQWASEIAGGATSQQLVSLSRTIIPSSTRIIRRYSSGKRWLPDGRDGFPNDKAVSSDMQNARVQVYGVTAILTYNFTGIRMWCRRQDQSALAKSTRVYVKEGGHWTMVHANFLPAAGPAR